MHILITNDDGIRAPGLRALHERLSERHRITVVAPDRERSAVGHGITLNDPLWAEKISLGNGCEGYAVSGKPADCVKYGVLSLNSHKPDIIISGINPGANVGISINYSGTVAAAREAAFYGIPAMAVSIRGFSGKTYSQAACFAEKMAEDIQDRGLPFGTMLNVNIPDIPWEDIPGVRISRQGIIHETRDYFEERTDPRNRTYLWLGPDQRATGNNLDVDGDALAKDYITITPIQCDMTDYGLLEEMKTWGIGKNRCRQTAKLKKAPMSDRH